MRSPSPAKITVCSPTTLPPRRVAADVALAARPDGTVADANSVVRQRYVAARRRRLAEHQRRPGGRVDLVAMVHLDDLDVEVRVERLRHAPRQRGEQIDAEAHVAGLTIVA